MSETAGRRGIVGADTKHAEKEVGVRLEVEQVVKVLRFFSIRLSLEAATALFSLPKFAAETAPAESDGNGEAPSIYQFEKQRPTHPSIDVDIESIRRVRIHFNLHRGPLGPSVTL